MLSVLGNAVSEVTLDHFRADSESMLQCIVLLFLFLCFCIFNMHTQWIIMAIYTVV